MLTRTRAAATAALLLTASATALAAAGGPAQATTHPHTAARAAAAPVVTITANKSGVKLSTDKIRPGKTMFAVTGKAHGSIQLLRLKSGYTLADLAQDIGPLMNGDTAATKRVDKHVVFYGGMPIPAAGAPAAKWGTDIDRAGTYYVINLKRNDIASFKAKGTHQTRSLPKPGGTLGMKGSMSFNAPASDPHRGWMKTTNNATQPHFIDLGQVLKSTTDQDVMDWLSAPTGPPPFAKPNGADVSIEVVSPGHTIVWKYHAPKGKYVALCFYPDKTTGVPHAFAGPMFALLDLT